MERSAGVSRSLVSLKLTGSHYDVGYELGKRMGKEIREYLAEMDGHIKMLKQFADSNEGRETYKRFLDTVTSSYPLYRRELEGTADGAGIEFEKLFLLSIEPELTTLFGDNSVVELSTLSDESRHLSQSNGCTDIYVRNTATNTFVLGHSEDGAPSMDKAVVWLDMDITDTWNGETVNEKFLAFTIAGTMPGNMFNIMSQNLMSSANNVYQKTVNRSGIPRRFFMRAILSAKSFEDVVKTIHKPPGIASAYNINLIHPVYDSSVNSSEELVCTSIELAGNPNGVHMCITPCEDFFTHTNLFQYLTTPCYQEESSIQREKVLESWRGRCSNMTKSDVIKILSNQDNSSFPVFRTGKKPDYLSTGCI
ncbi:beta-alanyl-dopamine/carcinine hydrolase-like, partial [Ylistrum balloti]|uniref:beta-alanyl-dopamine/carcinine hydrolase-like n=1 Tax=Ylistrum balloti TaxID=509963 RepID=UPI002905EC46